MMTRRVFVETKEKMTTEKILRLQTFLVFILLDFDVVHLQVTVNTTVDQTTASYGNITKFVAYQNLRTELGARVLARQKAPPIYYSSHDSSIAISFEPLQIIAVDGMSQVLTLTSIVTLTWRDPEIVWDPVQYAGVASVQLPSADLWSPSVIVPKASDSGDLEIGFPEMVDITYQGVIIAFTPAFVTSLCSLDMTYFPFDDHICSAVFLESSFYNMTSFIAPPTDVQSHFGTYGEWIMYRHWCITNISHMTPPFQYVTCYMGIRRRSLFYVLNLIGPMAMTSVMTLFVFWIPARSGEKIGYVLSIYTSTSIFLSYIEERIPKNMDRALVRINILLLAVVVQVLLATIGTTVVLRRYKKELKRNKVDSVFVHEGNKNMTSISNTKLSNKELDNQKNEEKNELSGDDVKSKNRVYYVKELSNLSGNLGVDIATRSSSAAFQENIYVTKKTDDADKNGKNYETCNSENAQPNRKSAYFTHRELDKLFLVLLTLLTIIIYIVVYLY